MRGGLSCVYRNVACSESYPDFLGIYNNYLDLLKTQIDKFPPTPSSILGKLVRLSLLAKQLLNISQDDFYLQYLQGINSHLVLQSMDCITEMESLARCGKLEAARVDPSILFSKAESITYLDIASLYAASGMQNLILCLSLPACGRLLPRPGRLT